MTLLILTLIMLLSAPIIYRLASQYKRTWATIEKITRLLIALLVLIFLLPECVQIAGWLVLIPAIIGLFIPSTFERLFQTQAKSIHILSVIIALSGLVVHAMMDGAALNMPELAHTHQHDHGHWQWLIPDIHALPLAVVLHSLPVGLFIWGLFIRKFGFWMPFAIIILNVIATIAGFVLSGEFLWQVHDSVQLAYFQALFSGALLHIVLDSHGDLGHEHTHHH